jgi:hypothetical protein
MAIITTSWKNDLSIVLIVLGSVSPLFGYIIHPLFFLVTLIAPMIALILNHDSFEEL